MMMLQSSRFASCMVQLQSPLKLLFWNVILDKSMPKGIPSHQLHKNSYVPHSTVPNVNNSFLTQDAGKCMCQKILNSFWECHGQCTQQSLLSNYQIQLEHHLLPPTSTLPKWPTFTDTCASQLLTLAQNDHNLLFSTWNRHQSRYCVLPVNVDASNHSLPIP